MQFHLERRVFTYFGRVTFDKYLLFDLTFAAEILGRIVSRLHMSWNSWNASEHRSSIHQVGKYNWIYWKENTHDSYIITAAYTSQRKLILWTASGMLKLTKSDLNSAVCSIHSAFNCLVSMSKYIWFMLSKCAHPFKCHVLHQSNNNDHLLWIRFYHETFDI